MSLTAHTHILSMDFFFFTYPLVDLPEEKSSFSTGAWPWCVFSRRRRKKLRRAWYHLLLHDHRGPNNSAVFRKIPSWKKREKCNWRLFHTRWKMQTPSQSVVISTRNISTALFDQKVHKKVSGKIKIPLLTNFTIVLWYYLSMVLPQSNPFFQDSLRNIFLVRHFPCFL